MTDKRRLRKRLQNALEAGWRIPGSTTFVLEVIDFLKMNQNRHAQLGGERVHTPELRAVGGEVVLHLAESSGAGLHAFRECLDSLR